MKTFKIGCDADNAPYTYRSDGAWKGLELDFASRLFSAVGLSVELVAVPWNEFFSALRNGTVNAVFSGISATAERKSEFLFSKPYFDSPETFFGRSNVMVKGIANGSDVIGVLAGSNHEQYLRRRFPGARLILAHTMSSLAVMLEREVVDVVLMELNGTRHWFPAASEYGPIGEAIVDREFFGEGSAFAIHREDEELMHAIDSAIDNIIGKSQRPPVSYPASEAHGI